LATSSGTVEEWLLTSTPIRDRREIRSLLETPSSLAISYTRGLLKKKPYFLCIGLSLFVRASSAMSASVTRGVRNARATARRRKADSMQADAPQR